MRRYNDLKRIRTQTLEVLQESGACLPSVIKNRSTRRGLDKDGVPLPHIQKMNPKRLLSPDSRRSQSDPE
jgi:hypothetical protein